MSGFWDMGGYAAFVWPSYALVALALVGLAISSRRRQRRMNERAARLRGEVRGAGASGISGTDNGRKNDS